MPNPATRDPLPGAGALLSWLSLWVAVAVSRYTHTSDDTISPIPPRRVKTNQGVIACQW